MKHCNKPSSADKYLKGIIRSGEIGKVEVKNEYAETQFPKGSVIKDDFSKYWHSIEDSSLKQYLDLTFYNSFVEVSSYLFSTRDDGIYYTIT